MILAGSSSLLILFFNQIVIGIPVAGLVWVTLRQMEGLRAALRFRLALAGFAAAALLPLLAPLFPPSTALAETSAISAISTGVTAAGSSAIHGTLDALPWIWFSVALLFLIGEIRGHCRLMRQKRMCTPAPEGLRRRLQWPDDVDLLVAPRFLPSAQGVMKPCVILPSSLEHQVEAMVALAIARHELAHARGRHPLLNAILRMIRAILWPSVALWWLERQVRREREAAADAAALDGSRVAELPTSYARALIDIAAAGFHGPVPAGVPAGGADLEYRIRRILGLGHPGSILRTLNHIMIAMASVAALAFAPVAREPAPESDRGTATPLRSQSSDEVVIGHVTRILSVTAHPAAESSDRGRDRETSFAERGDEARKASPVTVCGRADCIADDQPIVMAPAIGASAMQPVPEPVIDFAAIAKTPRKTALSGSPDVIRHVDVHRHVVRTQHVDRRDPSSGVAGRIKQFLNRKPAADSSSNTSPTGSSE